MPLPLTIREYFQLPEAERVLLLEITRLNVAATTYFISDSAFQTEPTDNPTNLNYAAIIGGSGLPELRRTMPDAFEGSAATSFGTITLVDSEAAATLAQALLLIDAAGNKLLVDNSGTVLRVVGKYSGDVPLNARRGSRFVVKIAAPRRLYPYADAQVLMRGSVARVGGDSDGNVTIELTDGSEQVRQAVISVGAFPLSFGLVRNVEPFLIDPANLVYAVHDGPIEGVTAVYDQGEAFSPDQYIVDTSTGRVTMLNQPAGTVTMDVKGAKVDGVWLQSTEQIAAHLLDRAGMSSLQPTFSDMIGGTIGYYVTQSTKLGDMLTNLMRGAAAYWLIDRDGTFKARGYTVPGDTSGPTFDENTGLFPVVTFTDEDRLHSAIRYLCRRSWKQYQPRPGAGASLSPNVSSVTTGPRTIYALADHGTQSGRYQRYDGGNYITDGFVVGQTAQVSGYGNVGNNGPRTITAVSSSILTVADPAGTMVTEYKAAVTIAVAAANLTISVTTAPTYGTYTRNVGSFLNEGFSAGDPVFVSGFANDTNNGARNILSVTDTTLVVSDPASSMVAEAATEEVSIAGGMAVFAQRQGIEDEVDLASPDSELVYLTSQRLDTYFDDPATAALAAQRLLDIFGVRRVRYQATVPYTEAISLGDAVTLSFNSGVYHGIVVGVTDVFDGTYPVQKIEVLV